MGNFRRDVSDDAAGARCEAVKARPFAAARADGTGIRALADAGCRPDARRSAGADACGDYRVEGVSRRRWATAVAIR